MATCQNGKRFLFLFPILAELAFTFFLVLDHRMPRGHDTLQYYGLQYYFLNNAVTAGEVPQWIPFTTHGAASNGWYALSSGILQRVLMLFGGFLHKINFLPLFHLGIFFDELLLMIGTWLLAKRYFASPYTRCFVVITVTGSSFWMGQPWFNFHFYFAIPLILHFLHEFFDTGRVWPCFLAGNLLAVQLIGNLPYFAPVIGLAVFVYFAVYLLFSKETRWERFSPWKIPLYLGIFLVSAIPVYGFLKIWIGEVVDYNPGRGPDRSVALMTFLTYGGNLSLRPWLGIFFRLTPIMDCSLYFGICAVSLAWLYLLSGPRKESFPFLLTAGVLVLLSLGGFVSYFLFQCWPFMKYYRHLTMVNPVAKLFLCFFAGFGFDQWIVEARRDKWRVGLVVFGLALLSLASWLLSAHPDFASDFFENLSTPRLFAFKWALLPSFISSFLKISSACALATLLALILALRGGFSKTGAILLLGLQTADLLGYKFQLISLASFPLDQRQYAMNRFQAMPYPERREMDFQQNPRAIAFGKDLFLQEAENGKVPFGIINWNISAFLFSDLLNTTLRTDYWQWSLDDYWRACWKYPLRDPSLHPPKRYNFVIQEFPTNDLACLKLSGFKEPKLQVFQNAASFRSDAQVASLMGNAAYRGDILLLSSAKGEEEDSFSKDTHEILSSQARLPAKCEVTEFNANHIALSVDPEKPEGGDSKTPKNGPGPWLFYSDAWHPFWKATVNGLPSPVFKANLGYKAVQIGPGKSRVRFSFKPRLQTDMLGLFGVNALFWVGMVLGLTVQCAFFPDPKEKVSSVGNPTLPKLAEPEPTLARCREETKSRAFFYILPWACLMLIFPIFLPKIRNDCLMVAAGKGDCFIARTLLWFGADPNTQDSDGNRAVDYASMEGHASMVRLLIDKGRNTQPLSSPKGLPPLFPAVLRGYVDVVKILLENGADGNPKTSAGVTPLMTSARDGDLKMVKLLLEHGAKINAQEQGGKTSLYIAVLRGHLDVAQILLENGADGNSKTSMGTTPLMIAAWEGNLKMAKLLLEHGAKINSQDQAGRTALMFSAYAGRGKVLQFLMKNGADPDLQDKIGRSAFQYSEAFKIKMEDEPPLNE